VNWWGNVKERGHLENLGVDGRIITLDVLKTWKRDQRRFSCTSS
jgi:hypothetical protein